ncbi:hypothetical protein GCM10022221_33090 [Actinocorallia aurea]
MRVRGFRRVTAAAALAVAVGVVVAVPMGATAPTSAAKCAEGSWRLSATSTVIVGTFDGEYAVTRLGGGEGQHLTIRDGLATVDFAEAAPVVAETSDGTVRTAHSGVLRVRVRLSGDARGRLVARRKTAEGEVRARSERVKPSRQADAYSVTESVRSSGRDDALPFGLAYTCAEGALTFTGRERRSGFEAVGYDLDLHHHLAYRRA